MRLFLGLALLFVQTLSAANFEDKKALIVTIDQKTLGNAASMMEGQEGAVRLSFMLQPLTNQGALGSALSLLLEQLGTKPLINAWDDARAEWIAIESAGKYDRVFIARGEQTRDDDYMASVWAEALDNHDIVDYVSLVHGGDQLIKDEWKVPVTTNKLRMVYSEACGGGSGREHFAMKYGALVSAGHNAKSPYPSASPLFSFTFLEQWFNGESFQSALELAWKAGSGLISNPLGFGLARFVANYQSEEEAIDGSLIVYAWHAEVDPNAVTIATPRGARVDGDVVESSTK